MNVRLFLFAPLLFLVAACGEQTNAADVKVKLESALEPGADQANIEAYLQSENLPFSYDEFRSRYQSIIRDSGTFIDHAVVIYVYVDENRRFLRVETHDSYTGP